MLCELEVKSEKQFKRTYFLSLTHGLIRGLIRITNEIITVLTVYKLIHTTGYKLFLPKSLSLFNNEIHIDTKQRLLNGVFETKNISSFWHFNCNYNNRTISSN